MHHHNRLPRTTYALALRRVIFAVVVVLFSELTLAQEIPSTENVKIDFPDQIDLAVIIDYVGKTLGVHFVYGEEVKGQKIDLRPSPLELPKSQLLTLLASLLRARELAMVEESPGMYRILRSENSAHSVSTLLSDKSTADPQSLRMVTQVISVPAADVKAVADKLSGFLSSTKGGLVAIPEAGKLIITDYESRIAVLRELLTLLSSEATAVETRTIKVSGADPVAVATQASAILAESHKVSQKTGTPPSVRGEVIPGAVLVIGSKDQITEAEKLIQQLVPGGVALSTKAFSTKFISVDRAKNLINHVALAPGSGISAPATIYEDAQAGRLFVTAETSTLEAIAKLLEKEDLPQALTQKPMRVYRPKYRSAEELLASIGQLLGQSTGWTPESEDKNAPEKSSLTPGPNKPPATPGPGQIPPTPPAAEPNKPATSGKSILRVQGADYVLTADKQTNSILAIGTREFHAQLVVLLEDLDRRRPQVLIEMTLVGITLSDSLNVGFELESLDLGEAWDYILFSNFGLSTIDVKTGQRVLSPGLGANGALIRPDKVPVIMQALGTKAKGRIISTPKILVSDNTRGTLRNVDEAPFTSVNASQTVATTSFAGFESAGTTLNVTPHLSEGDFVTLDYELTFSNFAGASGSANVPPPRTTNSFTSTVEVPDGYTLVTGGLVVENTNKTVSEVPLLGQIPGIGYFFQSNSKKNNQTKIFAFIRPTILRDDEFEALKFVTLKDAESAGIAVDKTLEGAQWMH